MAENNKENIKRQPKKQKEYTQKDLEEAIHKVKSGESSSYAAQKKYGIPRSTIENHIRGKVNGFKTGRPTLFSDEQEKLIFEFIVTLSKWGYPPNKEEFVNISREFASKYQIKFNNKDWLPSEDWLASFRTRWREKLGFRVANNLAKNRAKSITKKSLDGFYDLIETHVNQLDLNEKPQNIFNCDETNFASEGSKNKVFCEKGAGNINKLASNNEKLNYSVNVCCSASGLYLPIYVLYKASRLYTTWTLDGPANCYYNVTENGWMEVSTFKDWLENVFIKHTRTIEGSKLLILDGHKSHITTDVVKLARENDITILCLPPHTTHLLQPLDVAVFKPAKSAWRKIVNEKLKGNLDNISKEIFPSLLKQLMESNQAFLRRHAVAGFEATGIFPFNRTAIPKDKWQHLSGDNSDTDLPDTDSSVINEELFNESESESELIVTDSVTSKPIQSSYHSISNSLRDVTNESSQNSQNQKRVVESVMTSFFKSKDDVRLFAKRKLVGNSGACITSEVALEFLEQEQATKRAKLDEAADKKREREEKKKAAEEELERKKQAKLKKQEEQQKEQELKAIKKINKSKKQCYLCEKNLKNDQKHKTKWISCFDCCVWCCYKCLPNSFKGASAQTVYKCNTCTSSSN